MDRIKQNTLTKIPSYKSIMGLQFENLVLNNRRSIYEILEIDPGSIVVDNPYFQNATRNRAGCQIDYMIQTEYGILYLFEIKFSKRKIQPLFIKEVTEKIQNLSLPRGISIRPILVHVNGVSEALKKSKYFTHMINFSDLLAKSS